MSAKNAQFVTVRPAIASCAELMTILAGRPHRHHTKSPIDSVPVVFGRYDDEIPVISHRSVIRVDQSGFKI